MKIELPCEIVRDLLPNYIDGLASSSTVETVATHLERCQDCKELCEGMKKDYQSTDLIDKEGSLESQKDKALFKKINHKIHKKVKIVIVASVIIICFGNILSQLLFYRAIKEVPLTEVSVSASVYDLNDLVDTTNKEVTDDTAVITRGENGKEEFLYHINIPELPNTDIAVSGEVLEKANHLSVITWSSPYVLTNIDWECKTVNDLNILYVTGFKTTLLNNKTQSTNQQSVQIEHEKIDQIVYRDKDNSEIVLWEAEHNE